MTTTDELALRRAILAQPAEDTPRLAYADWLDENDQPIPAAYVRLAVNRPGSAAEHEFFARHRRHLDTWLGLVLFKGCDAVRRRGFVAGLERVRPRWWVGGRGDDLLRRHPIERVRFAEVPQYQRAPGGPSNTCFLERFILEGDYQPVPDRAVFEEWWKENKRFGGHLDGPDYEDETTRAVCRARWPGVEFYLPGDPDDATLARIERDVKAGVV